MKEINLSRFIRYGIVTFFLLPFIFFAWKFNFRIALDPSELWWALKNSVYQSTLAACFVMLLAVPMSFGLASLSPGWRLIVGRLLLLPQILPVLYTALIVFTIVNPFPMGSAGIIILFVVVNLGLATVLTEQASSARVNSHAVTAEVYSLSRLKFFTKIYIPLMIADLLQIFFLVFVFCMSSFSIPLLAGDGRAVNLEILVFEKVFIDNNWAAGFGVSLVQSFFIFAMSFLMLETASAAPSGLPASRPARYMVSAYMNFLTGIYLILYVAGYAYGILTAFEYINFIFNFSAEIIWALLFSLKCLAVFVTINSALLYLCLWDYISSGRKLNPSLHFVSLSTVVAGFAVYLFFPTAPAYDLIKLLLCASVLLFVPLFKLFLQSAVEGLRRQIQVAELFGIPPHAIIVEVIGRQIKGPLFLWVSVLSMWFASDYAISRSVGVQKQTLGLMAQSFLSSYRMHASFLMSFIIIVFVILFLLLLKFSAKALYVAYKKSSL